MVAAKRADFNEWAKKFGITPVLARILRNRGLTEEGEIQTFLKGTLSDCHSPWLMKDMDRAVEVLECAIAEKKKIRVIGDYDVDGICSAYILTKGLRCLGGIVDTAIPHRIHDGYGLNDHLIEMATEDGVELILTCDNGIAAAPQIALAGQLGIDVVVTDHHEVPYEIKEDGRKEEKLPGAKAVVDPKRGDCPYPFKGICGGVVAYKLLQAFLEKRGESHPEMMEELLEFAAFATVCDVMELLDENRIIVKEGLRKMRKSRNLGLQALMEVNGLNPAGLSAHHLGFVLGPCLNATGRLDTAKRALELLQSESKGEAMCAARELKDLNDSRKTLTLEGVEQAGQYIRDHSMEKDKVLVIYLPDVHESLAGIIAGRIRETYFRPVFVLTLGEDGVKGSGRSIEAYHMYQEMTKVKELFTRYGGHKLAAGLSMKEENIGILRESLNRNCALTERDFVPVVHIDVPMPVEYSSLELARELEVLEPFGVGNPKPLFAQKDLIFVGESRMGKEGSFARFCVRTSAGHTEQMVLFRGLERFEQEFRDRYGSAAFAQLLAGKGTYPVAVTYQLGVNSFRGKADKQLIIQNFKLS